MACDGAETKDAIGFNKADAKYGTMLALVHESKWSETACYQAWMMLAKYKNQLLLKVHDYDAM